MHERHLNDSSVVKGSSLLLRVLMCVSRGCGNWV